MTRNGISGSSLLGPDGTYGVTENSPLIVNVPSGTSVEIVPPAAAEPVADTTVDETSESVGTDTDGGGVADSDEVDLYGTDPRIWTRTAIASRTGALSRQLAPNWSPRTAPPQRHQASIVAMTASRLQMKRPSGWTPPPQMPTAMATTRATR